jgi:hypothetical protein
MSNELRLQQQTEKEPTIPYIEAEIECPCCYDKWHRQILIDYTTFVKNVTCHFYN